MGTHPLAGAEPRASAAPLAGTAPLASTTPLAGTTPTASNEADWLAPTAREPVRALVDIPGSKSITNRALVLAALASTPTQIAGPLIARDTELMAGALRALGCRIEESAGCWLVEPGAPGDHGRPIEVDVGNAGTVLRFLPAVAALTAAEVRFRGDPRVSQRPVGPLLTALRALGAQIADDGSGRALFTVHGRGHLRGGVVVLDASSSSQFVSGLLLAAARFDAGAEIRHDGPPVPSMPHIEMTTRMLRAAGVPVEASYRAQADASQAHANQAHAGMNAWKVLPGPISPGRIAVEPDFSNALPFLAAAMVTGGEVVIPGWPAKSLQPAARIIELLSAMGATVRHGAQGLQVNGSGRVDGVAADLSEVGELTPVLTALAALASTPSQFTGIGHLRAHESDRLAALASEIGKLGGDVTELADGLRIRPRPLRAEGVIFDSHDDHRLVMAAAVLGLAAGNLLVRDAATVGKTFPEFRQLWSAQVTRA
jgi:3-phosphoshikimate 1-carboxyvinyltransferase